MTIPFRPRWYFFIALVSITFIAPLSIHLFIPAMPAVKEAFGISTGMAQLTLSLEMLSMACFTVVYGGLSDRFGCKRVLLSGLVLFTCGAASCMAAANLPMLLAGRAAAAHRAARRRYLGSDGHGALCRSDRSPARRLDGDAGQGLVHLNGVNATDLCFSSGLLPGSVGNPE